MNCVQFDCLHACQMYKTCIFFFSFSCIPRITIMYILEYFIFIITQVLQSSDLFLGPSWHFNFEFWLVFIQVRWCLFPLCELCWMGLSYLLAHFHFHPLSWIYAFCYIVHIFSEHISIRVSGICVRIVLKWTFSLARSSISSIGHSFSKIENILKAYREQKT